MSFRLSPANVRRASFTRTVASCATPRPNELAYATSAMARSAARACHFAAGVSAFELLREGSKTAIMADNRTAMKYFLAKTDPETYSVDDLEREERTTW